MFTDPDTAFTRSTPVAFGIRSMVMSAPCESISIGPARSLPRSSPERMFIDRFAADAFNLHVGIHRGEPNRCAGRRLEFTAAVRAGNLAGDLPDASLAARRRELHDSPLPTRSTGPPLASSVTCSRGGNLHGQPQCPLCALARIEDAGDDTAAGPFELELRLLDQPLRFLVVESVRLGAELRLDVVRSSPMIDQLAGP